MFNHRHWQRLLAPYVLGELTDTQKAELESHLNSCPSCSRECALLECVDRCATKMQAEELPATVQQAVREQVIVATHSRPSQSQQSGSRPGWRGNVLRRTGLAAAAAFLLAFGLWLLVGEPSQSAYALSQTSDALANKQSLHVKVWFPGGRLKEEFWAEFNPDGTTRRFRQEEDNQLTVWADNVKTRYVTSDNVLLLTRSNGQENVLEQTDPQLMVQRLLGLQSEGRAIIEIAEPTHEEPRICVTATDPEGTRFRQSLLVDPKTLLVSQILQFTPAGEGWRVNRIIDVLEYNQPFSAELFTLATPPDVVVADQVSPIVGMTQDGLTQEELAVHMVRRALEAWSAGELDEAARLFGGIDVRCLSERLAADRPIGSIEVDPPTQIGSPHWPKFEVPCRYAVERESGIQTVQRAFTVVQEPVWQKVDDQPPRWWITPTDLIHLRGVRATSNVGLEQGKLTNEQIAVQVVREFFDGIMAGDFGKAARLAGGAPVEQIAREFSEQQIVRVISISEPQPHEGKSDHFRVAFEIEVDTGGNKQVIRDEFSVEPVEGQPGRWEID